MNKIHEFRIEKEESDMRLDIFLASCSRISLSRTQVKKAIEAGNVRINDLPTKPGQRLRAGDRLALEEFPAETYAVEAENIPLDVLYEDRSLLVIDKPAGLVVHPAAGNYRGTLVNALLHHCRDLSGIGGVLRPGIVHRLDKGTSGLMVVAKSDAAHQGLAAQFKQHEVRKSYLALVYGDIKGEGGTIDAPVGRDVVDRKLMSTRSRRGKEARTHWNVSERYGVATLLKVDIETGRTHQIRVHLRHAGYPILGDVVYGGARREQSLVDMKLRTGIRELGRPALHSARLCFRHPVSGLSMDFSSPLPQDIHNLCAILRTAAGIHPREGKEPLFRE